MTEGILLDTIKLHHDSLLEKRASGHSIAARFVQIRRAFKLSSTFGELRYVNNCWRNLSAALVGISYSGSDEGVFVVAKLVCKADSVNTEGEASICSKQTFGS